MTEKAHPEKCNPGLVKFAKDHSKDFQAAWAEYRKQYYHMTGGFVVNCDSRDFAAAYHNLVEAEKKSGGPITFAEDTESEILCPNCVPPRKLVVKTNRKTGSQFLGCPNWPLCEHTRPIPEAWYMRAQGQKELF